MGLGFEIDFIILHWGNVEKNRDSLLLSSNPSILTINLRVVLGHITSHSAGNSESFE
jgi:hypothetical protein